jgi:hypothetical protein
MAGRPIESDTIRSLPVVFDVLAWEDRTRLRGDFLLPAFAPFCTVTGHGL